MLAIFGDIAGVPALLATMLAPDLPQLRAKRLRFARCGASACSVSLRERSECSNSGPVVPLLACALLNLQVSTVTQYHVDYIIPSQQLARHTGDHRSEP